MVIVLEKNIPEKEKQELKRFLERNHFKVNEITGEEDTIFGAVGRLSIDPREVEILPGVARVIPISKPYKMASREFKKDNTVVELTNSRGQKIRIGGNRLVAIAGPCAVENREQMMETARQVASAGAVMLRGGAYKPRTSPYAFQGLGEEGLKLLKEAGEAYGLPVVTEIVSLEHIPYMLEYDIDVLQIGARNMPNFELLKKVGALGRPVILKRGISATIEEWLMAAEYLLSSGTDKVILCERGIRTYEKATRNTLDLSAIPIVHSLTHLPVIVDPSHAVGIRDKVAPMALAAVASGADGLIIEVHNCPDKALSDGAQSLYPVQFEKLMRDIDVMCPVVGKEMSRIRAVPSSASSCVQQNLSAVKENAAKGETVALRCAYSGSRGAYAEQAVSHYFDNTAESVPVSCFREVFQAVQDGRVNFGMIPIENCLAGSVFDNYDNLLRFDDVSIVGAVKLRIEHSLLAPEGTDIAHISTVYSHPQGFAQCQKFLAQYPQWNLVECTSTTSAAATAAEHGDGCAAIASANAAPASHLHILKTGIETDPKNYTRFLVIAPNNSTESVQAASSEPNTATISFTVKDESGRLYECLGAFRAAGINLTRLESRPIQGKPWQYMFYADVSLSAETRSTFEDAIHNLHQYAEDVRVLGVYTEIN